MYSSDCEINYDILLNSDKNSLIYKSELAKLKKQNHSEYLAYTKKHNKEVYHDEKNYMEVNRQLDFSDLETWRWGIMVFESILCYGF